MKKLSRAVDGLVETWTRRIARQSSRRSFLGRFGVGMVGMAGVPLLPVARAAGPTPPVDDGDAQSCDYWRYCAIDGFLCSCCGGSHTACPPGTEVSPITWIGTCRNPSDGIDYIISYNDCCGDAGCGRCFCHRNEGDKPTYMPFRSNDINWCLGTTTNAYHCSVSIVLGVAVETHGG